MAIRAEIQGTATRIKEIKSSGFSKVFPKRLKIKYAIKVIAAVGIRVRRIAFLKN